MNPSEDWKISHIGVTPQFTRYVTTENNVRHRYTAKQVAFKEWLITRTNMSDTNDYDTETLYGKWPTVKSKIDGEIIPTFLLAQKFTLSEDA